MSGTLAYTVQTLRTVARRDGSQGGNTSGSARTPPSPWSPRIGQPINQPFNASDPCPSESTEDGFAACCASNRMTPSCAQSQNNPFAPSADNPFAGGGTGQTSADAGAQSTGPSLFGPQPSAGPGVVRFLRFGPLPNSATEQAVTQQPAQQAPAQQPGAIQGFANRVGLPVWALAVGAGGVLVVGYLLFKKDERRAA